MIAESGRQILWTPPGTSGFVQPCDDLVNASFQNGFMKVKDHDTSKDLMTKYTQSYDGTLYVNFSDIDLLRPAWTG